MQISKVSRFFFAPLVCLFIANSGYCYTERHVAIVQVMNKAAGKTQTLRAPIGENINFEKLNIIVRSCKQSNPFDAENFYAFVEISKSDESKIFSNWMDRNNPGKNPVQNPDYDMWLVRCE